VIYQNYTTVEDVERVKAYSDKNVYIERDGALYSEADDFAYQNRKYTETDIPVEAEATTETEQKAAAFDYLTGRSESSE
ncbi:MAG: hypothetical protein II410_08265, partial [Ruminococcus sp.]|nr:hypothetical protein [Ruminococcus sp.]